VARTPYTVHTTAPFAANDWGDVSPVAKQQNEEALKDGGGLDGQFVDQKGVSFFITSTRNGVRRVSVAEVNR